MGFPTALWFEVELISAAGRRGVGKPEGLAGRIGCLFDATRDPKTGEPHTNSLGSPAWGWAISPRKM
jgi:hypothetical protein